MKQRHFLSLSAISSVLLFASTSFAVEPGMYLGLNVFSGSIESDTVSTNSTSNSNSQEYELDDSGVSGGGLTIGYASSKYFAIELAADYMSDLDYTSKTNNDSATRSQYIGYFAAKPMIPIGSKFNLFARLGLAYVDMDVSFEDYNNEEDSNSNSDYSEANWDPYGAVGFSFTPTPSFEIGLGYNVISDNEGNLSYGSIEFNYHMVEKRNSAGFLVD